MTAIDIPTDEHVQAVQPTCAEIHERNTSGAHRAGFCRACAEVYEAINIYALRLEHPERYETQPTTS